MNSSHMIIKTLFVSVAVILLVTLGILGTRAESAHPANVIDAIGTDAIGTAFTYQGSLKDGGEPANGNYDFRFHLWGEESKTTLLGTYPNSGTIEVEVVDGYFTVVLDFGVGIFNGEERWLEIEVNGTLLSPLQLLTPTPYAVYAEKVGEHNHLGQTWVGASNALVISGSFATAPLVLSNSAGDGLRVDSAENSGVRVYEAGTPTTQNISTSSNGFEVDGAEGNGLYVGRADNHGVHIESAGNDGMRIESGQDGVQIGDGTDFSLYGLYIPNPGVPYTAIWPNTANSAGEWAIYTTDNIYANNVTASTLMVLARVTGLDDLTAGDLVAVVGMADPQPGKHDALPLVSLANPTQDGVIGVMESRMIFQQAEGKEDGVQVLHSVSGKAQDGDYVALTVFGITEVKVDTRTVEIAPGQRLTVSDVAGHVRALRSETLNGMVVTEGTAVVGIALDAPRPEDTTIPVFVTLP